MSLEPWAAARQNVENLLIQAGRSGSIEDLSAARRALDQFKADYPDRAYTVAAFSQALDGLESPRKAPRKAGSNFS